MHRESEIETETEIESANVHWPEQQNGTRRRYAHVVGEQLYPVTGAIEERVVPDPLVLVCEPVWTQCPMSMQEPNS